MKKVLVIIMLSIMLVMLCSCGEKATEESNYGNYFVAIKKYGTSDCGTEFVYDPVTRIVYVGERGDSRSGLTPYYIIKFKEPVIARYGINWTESELP